MSGLPTLYYGSIASGLFNLEADNVTVRDTLTVTNLAVTNATYTNETVTNQIVNGTLSVNGGIVLEQTSLSVVDTPYTVLNSDTWVWVGAGATGPLTLPVSPVVGQTVWVSVSATASAITVQGTPAASFRQNGAASQTTIVVGPNISIQLMYQGFSSGTQIWTVIGNLSGMILRQRSTGTFPATLTETDVLFLGTGAGGNLNVLATPVAGQTYWISTSSATSITLTSAGSVSFRYNGTSSSTLVIPGNSQVQITYSSGTSPAVWIVNGHTATVSTLTTTGALVAGTTFTSTGALTASSTVTSAGLITANAGLSGTTVSTTGAITAGTTLTSTGALTASSTVTATGLITANGGLTGTTVTTTGNATIAGNLIHSFPVHLHMYGQPTIYIFNGSSQATPVTTAQFYYLLPPSTGLTTKNWTPSWSNGARLAVPLTGLYNITWTCYNSTAASLECFIAKNAMTADELNSQPERCFASTGQSTAVQLFVSANAYLTTTDTLSIGFYLNSGSFASGGAAPARNQLRITLVSQNV